MMFLWIVVLVAIVVVLWLVLAGPVRGGIGRGLGAGSAEEILRQRYARGEIDRDTYVRMLEELRH